MHESPAARFWEVDFLRGCAVVLMVLFHLVYDLNYFQVLEIDVARGFWLCLARAAASLFLILVGVSLKLSHSRALNHGKADRFCSHLLVRSLGIFSLAMGITLVTYLFIGKGFILFGVLHLIALSLLLAFPFLRLGSLNFIFVLLFILIGWLLTYVSVEFPWLLWLGLVPRGFFSLDFFPVFPWFGLILVGIALGDLFFRADLRKIRLQDLAASSILRPVAILGQSSLAVYLIHQPVLIAAIYLCGFPVKWH
jgi:uncharacterized membrane protein